jgi:hypothetical protein
MKAHILVLPLMLAALAVASGCGEESQAEKEAVNNCPGVAQAFEGKCGSKEQDERTKHDEQVESEGHEIEGVIKHRAAEESANAIEEATK